MTGSEEATQFVGAVLINRLGHAYLQRRCAGRSVFPEGWDVVGGAVEPGETPTQALRREIREETGLAGTFDLNWFTYRWIRMSDHSAQEALAWVALDHGDDPLPLEPGKFSEGAWMGPADARLADNLRLGYHDHIPSAALMALYLSSANEDN